jgi:hypothetical protein
MAGESVLVEVNAEDVDRAEPLPVASPGVAIAKAQGTFERSRSGFEPIAGAVMGQTRELAGAPDGAGVE